MSPFRAKRVTRTYVQRIVAPPAQVFPLLDPVRETEWLDNWQCEMIYSASGLGEQNCVFKTQQPHEAETIWTVVRRDATEYVVEFVTMTPGSRVTHIRINLEDEGAGQTTARISYTITALNEEGNAFVDRFGEAEFKRRMEWWERSMNHFLETGNLLKAAGHPDDSDDQG